MAGASGTTMSGRNPSLIVAEDIDRILATPSINWAQFKHRRFLITGITGLLGGYLFETLATLAGRHPDWQIEVWGLARRRDKAEARFAHLVDCAATHLVIHDITQPLPALPPFDYIVHAASEASPKYFLADPVGTIGANVAGTTALLEIARRSGSRLLFLSSGTVYGTAQDNHSAITESTFGPYDPLDSRACYAESKRLAETLCAAYWRQFGVSTVIARISHTYGPGVELDDGRVFGDFIADAVAGRQIRVLGSGTDSRPFLYIADATIGLLLLLQAGAPGEAYNLGAESETSIGDLADLIARLSGQASTLTPKQDPEYTPSTAARSQGHFSINKLKALGWSPQTSVEAGFARTLRHFGLELKEEAP
jgi:nucleoside-diphosphate-sugar epimerase